MIADKEIEEKAAQLGLPPQQVEKDYVHSWILWAINSKPELRRLLVLKGGNALRKCYFPDTRFSKDLDFSSVDHIDPGFLTDQLREVCALVEARSGVRFNAADTRVEDKDLPFGVDALEARLYFKGFYNEERLTLKTQLDVTQFDTIYLPVQERQIIHPYSDGAECTGTVMCQKAEEILASKLTTLLHRRKPGDLFDLLYSLVVRGDPAVNRRELIMTFLKKSIFEPRPNQARNELLAVPMEEYRDTWATLLVPATALVAFDFVLANYERLINSLFDLVIPSIAGGVAALAGRRGRDFTRVVDFNYCEGNVRSALIQAGRTRRMIEIVYSNVRRFVEPYKLEYYVRKSDGVGNEYFWGWDTSGGRSSGPGIKMFFADKIQSARVIDRAFTPRYPVEF